MDRVFNMRLFNFYKVGIILLIFPMMGVFCFYGNLFKVFCAAILFVGLIFVCVFFPHKKDYNRKLFCVAIWGSALLIRIITCVLLNNNIIQISDFYTTLKHAQSGYFQDDVEYYRFFLHKMLYPYILNRLSLNTQLRIFMFQCLCTSFIPLILYKIGRLVDKESVGVISAILYTFWPGQIVYTAIVTEEHIASLITVLILYLILLIWTTYIDKKPDSHILFIAFSIGVLFALSSFFKDWALVIFVALVIVSFLFFFDKNFNKKWNYICVIGVIILTRVIFQTVLTSFLEDMSGEKANNGVIAYQMYESLNPNSDGGYNPELAQQYFLIAYEYNYDFKQINKVAIAELVEEIKGNSSSMPYLLLKKGRNAYEDDEQLFKLVFEQSNIKDSSASYKLFMNFGTVYYIFLICGILCTSILNKNNVYIMFINVCMVGGIFVSLLVESQSRYKYSIEPVWTILVAFSLVKIAGLIVTRMKEKREINE